MWGTVEIRSSHTLRTRQMRRLYWDVRSQVEGSKDGSGRWLGYLPEGAAHADRFPVWTKSFLCPLVTVRVSKDVFLLMHRYPSRLQVGGWLNPGTAYLLFQLILSCRLSDPAFCFILGFKNEQLYVVELLRSTGQNRSSTHGSNRRQAEYALYYRTERWTVSVSACSLKRLWPTG